MSGNLLENEGVKRRGGGGEGGYFAGKSYFAINHVRRQFNYILSHLCLMIGNTWETAYQPLQIFREGGEGGLRM